MRCTRRDFLAAAGATGALIGLAPAYAAPPKRKPHIITLSFDDGFKKSFIKTAEIFEKHKLSACLNVIATGHRKDFRPPNISLTVPLGDFGLWNELQARGHEIMPHGYKHANKGAFPLENDKELLSLESAKDLIRRCLDVFSKELKGFDAKQAVFNFPYNASTPELEAWLPTQVRAFRTGGEAINRLPHRGQTKLTCVSYGPGNCEAAIDREIKRLLAKDSGWLIFNTHGLDDEGWGPLRSSYLERLLEQLLSVETVDILPAGRALLKA